MNSKTVKDIMTTNCATVTLQDNVYEVAVAMSKQDVGFIPVVEGKQLIGCITDRDLVVRGYAQKNEGSAKVEKVMSRDVTTVTPDTTVDEAAKIMADKQIRRLPVVENGNLAGVVSIGDLAIRKIFENEAGDALSKISENEFAGAVH
ncbi:CBS domain-containing protein [Paenibacillus sp. YN15]|uniref:CBS domain-containing protein n=1 Tax=Paenibacillus sp. YN15 TaxID=1742774 RepID=UPI000DCCB9F6|nr:CBS domain-containing protein [Paenibacillus sp. YN15]RAV04534.1 CBS domain-containing protein [Paenibacillus sp. YN15]